MAVFPLISLILFSLFSTSTLAIPSETVQNAVEILLDSGYLSMALTFEMVAQTLLPQSSFATIFSPSDDAFIQTGQPSLVRLRYHFSPLSFSIESLRTLPFGTKIPTLYQNHSLIVTTSDSDQQISLNNVKIDELAIYDDGSLVIFGIDKFFDPSFQISPLLAPAQSPSSDLGCTAPFLADTSASGADSFAAAAALIKSRGYSVMASFLEMQLPVFRDQAKFTIFAPVDEVMEEYTGDTGRYSAVFHRHVLPCRVTWTDLVKFDDGMILQTLLRGFTIKITRSNDILLLNGVSVIFPDMYHSDWLVVHGLTHTLALPAKQETVKDSAPEL